MSHLAAVLTWTGEPGLEQSLSALRTCPQVRQIALAHTVPAPAGDHAEIPLDDLWSSEGLGRVLAWFDGCGADDLLWLLPGAPLLAEDGVRRLWLAHRDARAALSYGDLQSHPLVAYQPGSLRDDFDFGSALLLDGSRVRSLAAELRGQAATWQHGALYHLRLRLSEAGPVLHLPEPLYTRPARDERASGVKVFDYVDPRRQAYQREMEAVATAHLERIGARLDPPQAAREPETVASPVEASVVIPVRDRVRTVAEAARSALAQRTSFAFNVIVVDNHSSDGTTAALEALARQDPRLVHLVPARRDLGIGGCWNQAIFSPHCGRYAVQLDSDDLYDGDAVLQRLVDTLEAGPYAMVVGSYTTVSFDLQPLPPGLVDHREWSDANGHNNALRIAGLGAPRAFHTATLRRFGFPNVSYGEDYAVALRLCRSYRVGRVYDSLYWCRRWEGNTDSALPHEAQMRHAVYKDRLRSVELAARQALNRGAA